MSRRSASRILSLSDAGGPITFADLEWLVAQGQVEDVDPEATVEITGARDVGQLDRDPATITVRGRRG